jgi:hypothetical protein
MELGAGPEFESPMPLLIFETSVFPKIRHNTP